MNQDDRKNELQILELTDKLIETVMACGLLDEKEKKEKLVESSNLVIELAEKLYVNYLNGRTELLQNLLFQLTAQKLPDQKILESFSEFKKDLEQVIITGTKKFIDTTQQKENYPAKQIQSNKKELLIEVTKPIDTEIQEKIEIVKESGKAPEIHQKRSFLHVLKCIFPNDLLQVNYILKGQILPYYFPEKGLVLNILADGESANKENELRLKKLGLRVLEIPESDIHNPKRLERTIRRALL